MFFFAFQSIDFWLVSYTYEATTSILR